MATRFYLPSTGAASISPAFSTWSITTGADYLNCVTTRISSSMTDKATGNLGNLGANTTILSRVYISPPLAAQTIGASTIKGTIRAMESAANDNLDAMRLAVRIVSSDGTTYRTPVIYGPANSTVAEFNGSLRAKRLATGGATNSVVCSDGDRVVIEIGITNTGSGTSVNGTVNYGDDNATDLGDNETDTSAFNPFVEIAANLVFLATGTANITLGATTTTATGEVDVAGTSSITLGAVTTTADGDVIVSGTANQTIGAITLTAEGTVADAGVNGSADITLGATTVTAAGGVTVAGTANITLGAATVTATGEVTDPAILGEANLTIGAITQSATGEVDVAGVANITLGATTLSAQGALDVVGILSVTLSDTTTTATGEVSGGDPAPQPVAVVGGGRMSSRGRRPAPNDDDEVLRIIQQIIEHEHANQ